MASCCRNVDIWNSGLGIDEKVMTTFAFEVVGGLC